MSKNRLLILSIAVLLLLLLISCNSKTPGLILTCGWDEITITDISKEVPEKVWNWKAENSQGLPLFMRNKFQTTDECKSLNNGKQILVTSSGGGVALVEQSGGSTLFYASVPNAHSAEYLPGNYIAVASSFSPLGNRINLYSLDKPDLVVDSDSLYGAHGLVWDKKRKTLWALGTYELRSYSLSGGEEPSLKFIRSMELPDPDGHDLCILDNKDELCLSTGNHVWLYNIKEDSFKKHPVLGDESRVKSLSYNSLDGSTAYIKATEENWWAYYIRFAGSKKVIYLPGQKLYKARWVYN